jgi:hypothetical protein
MRVLFFVIMSLVSLSACTSKPKVIKSPCVARKGGGFAPCVRKPANQWLA